MLNNLELRIAKFGGVLLLAATIWAVASGLGGAMARLSAPSLFRANQSRYEAIFAKVKALRLPRGTSKVFYVNPNFDADSLATLQGDDKGNMAGKVNVWINPKGDASVQIIARDDGDAGFISFTCEDKPDLWKELKPLSGRWSLLCGDGD